MNIKVNRSRGLLGYRCKKLGAVCQTQSSMRKSRHLVKSMGSKKRKKKSIILQARVLFYIINLSSFPRSATFYQENSHVCVFTLATDFNKHLL